MLRLSEFDQIKSCLDTTVALDIDTILRELKKENISLEGWRLVEIPAEKVYCFYNQRTNEAFDYELDVSGKLTPHYYKPRKHTTITKFPAKTIRRAMKQYSL